MREYETFVLKGNASSDASIAKVIIQMMLSLTEGDQTRAMAITTELATLLFSNVKEEFFEEMLNEHVQYIREHVPKMTADLRKWAAEKGIKTYEDDEVRQ